MDLTPYNGLGIRAEARQFLRITNLEELVEAHRELGQTNIHVLGHGTNTVWGNPVIDVPIIKIEIPGIQPLEEDLDYALIRVGGGVIWDELVKWSVNHNLSGIEALSAIPGTVGAGPVQNIGAYGQEIKESIDSVSVFDWNTGKNLIMDKNSCEFSYRDSIFKRKKNLIITNITFKLSKKSPNVPNYPDTLKHFGANKQPTLTEIREAILEIRAGKLPDPKKVPNCGSFFKNPIIKAEQAKKLQNQYPDMPLFPVQKWVKVPAGWLIDRAGLKGAWIGPVQVYPKNALVLTTPLTNPKPEEVMKAKDEIVEKILSQFGIKLEMEPDLIT